MLSLLLSPLRRAVRVIGRIGLEPGDSPGARLRKASLSTCLAVFAPVFIGIIGPFYFHFGEWGGGVIYTAFGIGSLIGLIAFGLRPRLFSTLFFLVLVASLVSEVLATIVLGGFVNSSGAAMWGMLTVMGALIQYGPKKSLYWFTAYTASLCFALVASPWINASNHLPPWVRQTLFAINLLLIWGFSFWLLFQFLSQRDRAMALFRAEQQKSENLLLNLLPSEIAATLKKNLGTIADHHDLASILFADVVDFTGLSVRMTPTELVQMLNGIFSDFDSMAEKLGLEKIKTIGDCYMVAAGIPRSRADHAHALARLALEIREYARKSPLAGGRLSFRIGINSGPVVAGVIGRKKFIYDLWGDAVNTASRMESQGVPGTIQITGATQELIRDAFVCEERAPIVVKGKGEMRVWHVTSERVA